LTSALPQTYEHACIESGSDTTARHEVKCADVVTLIALTIESTHRRRQH
jgi:hypothetical protein